MKKRRFSILLSISALCLCLAAIAIGVYSVKNAQLTITGSIGFVAHGVKAKIDGTISGFVSEANIDSATQTETKTLSTLNLNGNEGSIDIGDVFFTDLVGEAVPNIILTLNLTNTSGYKIRANVNIPNLNEKGVTVNVNKTTLPLETNTAGTIIITFKLNNSEEDLTAINLATIINSNNPLITFVKYDGPYDGELYLENNKIYVNMGQKDGIAVRWYAIGKNGSAIGDVTTIDSAKYTFISEYALGDSKFNESSNTDTRGIYKDSLMQNYVNGTGTNTLDSIYGFSKTDFYKTIDAVDLPSETFNKKTGAESVSQITTPVVTGQTLWLISFDEFVTYFEPTHDDAYSYNSEKALSYYFNSENKAAWTTRSVGCLGFSSENSWEMVAIDSAWNYTGFAKMAGEMKDASSSFAVRPAFQLTVA